MLQCNLDTIDIELGLGVEGFSNIDEEKNMYLMNYTKVSYA